MPQYNVVCLTKKRVLLRTTRKSEAYARRNKHRENSEHVVEVFKIPSNTVVVTGPELSRGDVDEAERV